MRIIGNPCFPIWATIGFSTKFYGTLLCDTLRCRHAFKACRKSFFNPSLCPPPQPFRVALRTSFVRVDPGQQQREQGRVQMWANRSRSEREGGTKRYYLPLIELRASYFRDRRPTTCDAIEFRFSPQVPFLASRWAATLRPHRRCALQHNLRRSDKYRVLIPRSSPTPPRPSTGIHPALIVSLSNLIKARARHGCRGQA